MCTARRFEENYIGRNCGRLATIKIKCICAQLGGNMGPFATAAVALQIAFWFFLLAVGAAFVAALIRGTIEDVRDHKRIVAARIAQGFATPPPQWKHTIWTRQLRNQ
jgi:hypothetical protein